LDDNCFNALALERARRGVKVLKQMSIAVGFSNQSRLQRRKPAATSMGPKIPPNRGKPQSFVASREADARPPMQTKENKEGLRFTAS
jgi:hypothetical protein